ncbi:hypothetical protein [Paremcibacter congregatus]|uniref:hypothetical protein n=1 Tax=Paremcibacter congregatus TaxID=2043170 RepID=UPI003A8EC573
MWFFYKYLLSRLHWAGQISFILIALLYIYGKVPYALTKNFSEIYNTADKFVKVSVDAEVNGVRFKFNKVIKCSHDFSVNARDGVTRYWHYINGGFGVSNEDGQGLVFTIPEAAILCAPDGPSTYDIQSGEIRRLALLDNYENPKEIAQYDLLEDDGSLKHDYLDRKQTENIKLNVRAHPINSMKISFISEDLNEQSWISSRDFFLNYQNKSDPTKSYYAATVRLVDAKGWQKFDQVRKIIASLSDEKVVNISKKIKQSSMRRNEIESLRESGVIAALNYSSDKKRWLLNKNNLATLHFYGFNSIKPNADSSSEHTLWLNRSVTIDGVELEELYLNVQIDQNIILDVVQEDNCYDRYYFWIPTKNEILVIYPNWKILQPKRGR